MLRHFCKALVSVEILRAGGKPELIIFHKVPLSFLESISGSATTGWHACHLTSMVWHFMEFVNYYFRFLYNNLKLNFIYFTQVIAGHFVYYIYFING